MKVSIQNPLKIEAVGQVIGQWLPISLILILATSLYIYQLGTESLWMDELISVDQAKNEYLELLRVRPLYPLLLHIWMLFGSSDAWLRGLCVLFTLGSVGLTYQLGRRIATESVGILSALILTLSPLFINHAQEVRMYGPSTFFGLWGSLALVHALDKPKGIRIGVWAVMRWLAILTTPLNLLLLLPDIVLILGIYRKQPKLLINFLKGLVAIGLLWSPWIIHVAIQSADFMRGIKAPGAVDPAIDKKSSPGIISFLFQPGRFTAWSFGKPNSKIIHWFYNAYSTLVACLLGFALVDSRRSDRIFWAAAWGLLPLVPLLLVSQVSRSLWVDRYLLFTGPYIFILLAAGFIGVLYRWRLGALAIALIYLIAVGGSLKRYYTVLDRENWRGLVETINQGEQSGDLIVWSVGQTVPRALNHYYTGNSTIEVVERGSSAVGNEETAIEKWIMTNLPQDESRIWLVQAGTTPDFLSTLEKYFDIQSLYEFNAADVLLLTPVASESITITPD